MLLIVITEKENLKMSSDHTFWANTPVSPCDTTTCYQGHTV